MKEIIIGGSNVIGSIYCHRKPSCATATPPRHSAVEKVCACVCVRHTHRGRLHIDGVITYRWGDDRYPNVWKRFVKVKLLHHRQTRGSRQSLISANRTRGSSHESHPSKFLAFSLSDAQPMATLSNDQDTTIRRTHVQTHSHTCYTHIDTYPHIHTHTFTRRLGRSMKWKNLT